MRWRWRDLARGPALLALACFSGCSGCGGCGPSPDAYPDTVQFAPRTDWVVVELPKDVPPGDDPPGELEEAIRRANKQGGKVLDPAAVPAPLREDLDRFIRATFGTPGKPTVTGDEETTTLAAGLGLTEDRLAVGSRLYRDRCQECHGLHGDGRGPTAPWLTPHAGRWAGCWVHLTGQADSRPVPRPDQRPSRLPCRALGCRPRRSTAAD